MAAHIDNTVVAELWEAVAARRDLAGAERALRTAENLRFTELQRELGWSATGATTRPLDHQGRGWHDAAMPCKLATP